MDTAQCQWPQEIVVKPIEEIVTNICPKPAALERKARPKKEQALNCPRCNSSNTKFCYYNNYRLTQPRYFCKTCRRYWTEGGSLRNIPIGGGSRKNKRSSSSKKLPDLVIPSSLSSHENPKIHDHHGQDLNLAFPAAATTQGFRSTSEFGQISNIESNNIDNYKNQIPISSSTTTTTTSQQQQLSALELLTGISSRGLNSFMPMPVPDPRFPMQGFKPTLNFSLDGLGSGYGSPHNQNVQENNGRPLFPFEDLKQVSSTSIDHMEQNRGEHGDSSGYWTGMLGGGSW